MCYSLSLSYRDRVQFGCVVVCVSVIVVSVRLLLRAFQVLRKQRRHATVSFLSLVR